VIATVPPLSKVPFIRFPAQVKVHLKGAEYRSIIQDWLRAYATFASMGSPSTSNLFAFETLLISPQDILTLPLRSCVTVAAEC
jgi:hypothetical protein